MNHAMRPTWPAHERMTTDTTVSITLNGNPTSTEMGSTVTDLLRAHGRDPEQPGIAVAVNGRVVRSALWQETELADGDDVEVITAFQGG